MLNQIWKHKRFYYIYHLYLNVVEIIHSYTILEAINLIDIKIVRAIKLCVQSNDKRKKKNIFIIVFNNNVNKNLK